MSDKYINILKEIILQKIDKDRISVFLFGSRARGKNASHADIDIGLLSDKEIEQKTIRELREYIEDSIIPYHVDFVDFLKVDDDFKSLALKKIEIWNKSKFFKKNFNFIAKH